MGILNFDKRALQILQKLQQAGFDSWFVGGCVRDSILNKNFTDYDIATSAHSADVISLFKKNFEIDLKGEKFGCVCVNYDGLWLEITTGCSVFVAACIFQVVSKLLFQGL